MASTRNGGRGVLRGLIADIQPLWQNALVSTLTRLGFGSVAVCESSDELAGLVESVRPHLILVDPDGFPGFVQEIGGIEDRGAHQLVVVVTARPEQFALRATGRATEYLSKCSETREIERALHSVIAEHLDWATLTRRELEILRLAATGASNRQIAATLWLSDQTVKFHLAQAYRKLCVSDRWRAVERVRAIGLLPDEAIEPVRTIGRAAAEDR